VNVDDRADYQLDRKVTSEKFSASMYALTRGRKSRLHISRCFIKVMNMCQLHNVKEIAIKKKLFEKRS